jgi:uncharacterized membrane protein (UPF0127 family)
MIKWILLLFSPLFAVQIELGGVRLEVEVANTPEEMEIGLSGRTELPEGTGMLFVYGHPQIARFWMKDTKIPLSIGFFDAKKRLTQREDMDPPKKEDKKLTIYRSKVHAVYALEVPQGWFEKHHIKPGMRFSFVKNPFPDQANSIN